MYLVVAELPVQSNPVFFDGCR